MGCLPSMGGSLWAAPMDGHKVAGHRGQPIGAAHTSMGYPLCAAPLFVELGTPKLNQ